jgi:hypothetical protein
MALRARRLSPGLSNWPTLKQALAGPTHAVEALQAAGCSEALTEGQYGAVLKVCKSARAGRTCTTDACIVLKTVKPDVPEGPQWDRTDWATMVRTKQDVPREAYVLAHEAKMLYAIQQGLKASDAARHIQAFVAARAAPTKGPWLITEYIRDGVPLAQAAQSPFKASVGRNAPEYLLETLLVLRAIRQVLPDFVHADLHSNNIFLVPRTHACTLEGPSGSRRFSEKASVVLLDFGLSQANGLRGPKQAQLSTTKGLWYLDVFMTIEAFWFEADGSSMKDTFLETRSTRLPRGPKALLEALALEVFGPDGLRQLGNTAMSALSIVNDAPPRSSWTLDKVIGRLEDMLG